MRARLEIFIGLGKASYPGVFEIETAGDCRVQLGLEEDERGALTGGSHRSERESMGPAGQREKRGREARLGWGDTGPRRELGRARGERERGAGPRWRERKR